MPDHLHLIAHQGGDSVGLGEWIKAQKAVVGGLMPRGAGSGDPAYNVGPVSPPGSDTVASSTPHLFSRAKRRWRWQAGFHDHKLRSPESEARKWEYVCLNPVRANLVARPEDWPYAGEIYYERTGPIIVKGIPPLLETALLMERPHDAF
jgi:hypothetical protein